MQENNQKVMYNEDNYYSSQEVWIKVEFSAEFSFC
jgi:hypothetical protein